MKRLILIIVFLVITLTGFSQSIWSGFFKPVRKDLFGNKYALTTNNLKTGSWLMRPYVHINCVSITLDKERTVGSMDKTGIGISYSNFQNDNGDVINLWSINAMILFNISPTNQIPLDITPAVGISALKIISAGIGYDTGVHRMLLLLGISYNFTGL